MFLFRSIHSLLRLSQIHSLSRRLGFTTLNGELVAFTLNGNPKNKYKFFPSGAVDKILPASAGDIGLIPGPGRSHMPQSNSVMRHNY